MSGWQIALLAYAAGFVSSIILVAMIVWWSFADRRVAKVTRQSALSESSNDGSATRLTVTRS
jgi:hypothetical protein